MERRQPTVSGDTVLRACGLGLGYGRTAVLRGVDLEIRAGEFWFLLGPNGSGKTTLLRAILGLLEPVAGSLRLDPAYAARERIGFIPQKCELAPSLPTTVREMVSLGTVGLPRGDAAGGGRLAWALERVGLGGLAAADFRSLSGGQRQRALVARALVRRPRLLLLDEPTEGLDVASEDGLLRTLAALRESGAFTLLFVTHKLKLAARFATHVGLFHAGTICAGPRDEILALPVLEDAFGVPTELLEELRV
jgi:ABC-type Mn2+/Zn2+ transport system ATPase subunit